MGTQHKVLFTDSRMKSSLEDNSVDLMITSPPYPMIEMWDETFSKQNPLIKESLENKNGEKAFELMHCELDKVWKEVYRVLTDGGIACINIGDATRTLNGDFRLYSSQSRILQYCLKLGFQALPELLWRKQTNAPNKFMGSGMLPTGAYVTLEHEHILILRKGKRRDFGEEKGRRRESAFFWEERNKWFSDIWTDVKGTLQKLNGTELRERSAAYPFELAYRLINMFSIKGDIVLDPFLGVGTTILAAIASERNSVGFEIDTSFKETILSRVSKSKEAINEYIKQRLNNHIDFINKRKEESKSMKYENTRHNFPVITKQEKELLINPIEKITKLNNGVFTASYGKAAHLELKKNSNLMLYA